MIIMELTTKWRKQAIEAAEQVPTAASAAEQAQADAAQAVKDAAAIEKASREAARQAAAELAAVRTHASLRLDELEKAFAAARAGADAPVGLGVRGHARACLHGGSLLAAIGDLAAEDDTVRVLHQVWLAAGKLLHEVGIGRLEIAEDDPVVQRADGLECGIWSALLRRIRTCAGEI